MTPRLSVIIPFYDETAFLRSAVWSVLSQGIRPVEVIVVNDNPALHDEAGIRALGLPETVRVISHDVNRGLSAARNTGMAAASGRIIGFLDGDDYYVGGGLAAQLALAEESAADITHAMSFLTLTGSPAVQVLRRDAAMHTRRRVQSGGLVRLEEAQFFVSSWSSLYSRDFLDRAALRFDEEQVRFEDRLFVLTSVTAADRIATLGEPVRVWRRRAGSITTSATDLRAHRLQVQLLEKCLALMQARCEAGLPQRFARRELFNCVSRLLWDMDLLDAILASDDPGYAGLAARIPPLLGNAGFHNDFFNDPVVKKISRIGLASRRGKLSRTDFFALHAALRAGDFDGLRRLLPPLQSEVRDEADVPAGPAAGRHSRLRAEPALTAELVLHLGMHKTGSTFLQGQLRARPEELARLGVLVPETGQDSPDRNAIRPGGFAGHNGLVTALRQGDTSIWPLLAQEVRTSGARQVVLSCENLLLPFETDREEAIAELGRRLAPFPRLRIVAMVRRPDRAIEAVWRELVTNGRRSGARTVQEFAVDHGRRLTDLPGLFAPFERISDQPVSLGDHDTGALWPGFLRLIGLGEAAADLPELAGIDRYPTPGAGRIMLARLADAMITTTEMRAEVLRTLFRMPDPSGEDRPFLSPQERLELVGLFEAQSADWAHARGYPPDLSAWRAELAAEDWRPPDPPSVEMLEQLISARIFAERPQIRAIPRTGGEGAAAEPEPPALVLRLTPRPWVRALLERVVPRR